MIFKNREKLEAKGIVTKGDVIWFGDIKYVVEGSYLDNAGDSNDKIFNILGLDKIVFCSNSYGYHPIGGEWPSYKNQDYNSAYRVIVDLYKEIEKLEKQEKHNLISFGIKAPSNTLTNLLWVEYIKWLNSVDGGNYNGQNPRAYYGVKSFNGNSGNGFCEEHLSSEIKIITLEEWKEMMIKKPIELNMGEPIIEEKPIEVKKATRRTKSVILEELAILESEKENLISSLQNVEKQYNDSEVEVKTLKQDVATLIVAKNILSEEVERLEKKLTNKLLPKKKKGTRGKAWENIIISDSDYSILQFSYANNLPLLLKGPAGTGKSSFVKALAEEKGEKLIQYNFNGNTTVENLLGHKVLTGNPLSPMEFEDGPLTRAVRNGGIFLADEINASDPEVQFILNGLLENKDGKLGTLSIQGNNGETLTPHPNFRFYGTYNPGYLGTRTFGTSIMSRFIGIEVKPLPPEKEFILLKNKFKKIDDFIISGLIEIETQLRTNKNFNYDISTRDLIQTLTFIEGGFGIKEAIEATIANSLQLDIELALLKEVVDNIFKI